MLKSVLVLSDNPFFYKSFSALIKGKAYRDVSFSFFCSPGSPLQDSLKVLRIKEELDRIIDNYELVISAHCKQFFPPKLVKSVLCINIHPGFNPDNRGWFPQVFSIINGKRAGATIHVIDEELDHGPIIAQEEVEVHSWDTSLSVYERVQEKEIELLSDILPSILNKTFRAEMMVVEGNLNLKADFNALCKLDLNSKASLQEHLNLLRALTHGDYKNAWYIDEKSGEKVYVSVSFEKEKN